MVQGLVIFVVVMDGYLEWGWEKMVTVNLVSTIMENVQLVEEEALGNNNTRLLDDLQPLKITN